MKTGTLKVNGVYLSCPECGEAVEYEDTGSQLLDCGEYEQLPRVLQCKACDTRFRKPAFPVQRSSSPTA